MKRTNSRELWGFQKRPCSGEPAPGHKRSGARGTSSRAGYGLAGGPSRSASMGSGGAASGECGSVAGGHARGGLPEVCSPPPSKPLNFVPVSPFAQAVLAGWLPPPPAPAAALDRQQQTAQPGGSSGQSGGQAAPSRQGSEEWQEAEVLEDQENQQPARCSLPPAPATWLFSPVRPRPGPPPPGGLGGLGAAPAAITPLAAEPRAPGAGIPPISAPRPIPCALLSPTVHMPTPSKEALPSAPTPTAAAMERAPACSLTHAPSFGSWLFSAACRPPSPPPATAALPPAVAEAAANVAGDCRAAQPFEGGAPSELDRLLAGLGDSHYPASLMQWEQEELPDSEAE